MTLRELILSVDPEQYNDSALYQELRKIKPEYGSNRHISSHELSKFLGNFSVVCCEFVRLFVVIPFGCL